jgi:hypothetical protein
VDLHFMLQLYNKIVHEENKEIEVIGINVVENSSCVFKFFVHICYFVPTRMCKTATSVLDQLNFPYFTEYHVCAKMGTLRAKDRLTESLHPCACVLFLRYVLHLLKNFGEI